MNWTQKEMTLLKDLKQQEQLCIDKYAEYASRAHDPELKQLFQTIQHVEEQHLQTVSGLLGEQAQQNQQPSQGHCQACDPQNVQAAMQADKYLCMDALCTEKEVSGAYNTSIFEFRDPNVRQTLNKLQAAEQQHGEMIYQYMAKNGMYQAQ